MSADPLDRSGRAIQREAARWLAQREAGTLSSADQTRFDAWRAEDPRHGELFDDVAAAWRALDRLGAYPGAEHGADPDLLARPRPASRRLVPVVTALAACVAVGLLVWFKPAAERAAALAAPPAVVTHNRFVHLSDGSEVELAAGSEIAARFTPAERRVALVHGIAHFTVTKNPARPFIVEANGVSVRAVGTAFDVALADTAVQVLVSEGKVQVGSAVMPTVACEPVYLVAGQQTEVRTDAGQDHRVPVVRTLKPADLDRALSWQESRLEFDSTPLAEVVERINRHMGTEPGAIHLVIGDLALRTMPISGRIRPDNVLSFVDVLSADFGVLAEYTVNGKIILRKAR